MNLNFGSGLLTQNEINIPAVVAIAMAQASQQNKLPEGGKKKEKEMGAASMDILFIL